MVLPRCPYYLVCTCIQTARHACTTFIHACIHACMHYIHTYMHTCIHAYMHTHTHTHRYPHTYIHTHTHTDIHVLLHIIIIITMVLACLSCCWLCWCHPLIGFTARYFSAPRSKPISWTCLCLTNWKRMCCGSSSRGLYYHTFTLIRLCVVFFVASVCLPACLPSCLPV